MEKFKFEVRPLGISKGEYPGQFTPEVEKIIKEWLIRYPGKVLHLFSGSSKIGDVRVDFDNPNATINGSIEDYLRMTDKEIFDWTILDPPYLVNSSELGNGYKISRPFSCSIPSRRLFEAWAVKHTKRIIYLDVCCPKFHGFKREKVYFLLPGGYRNVRSLTISKNLW
jgi:hypothetical protein